MEEMTLEEVHNFALNCSTVLFVLFCCCLPFLAAVIKFYNFSAVYMPVKDANLKEIRKADLQQDITINFGK